ncbi:MAG: hypothetical protein J1E34_02690 [Oscillospiraceae bacterium]|nr:hypothetical protein [Oscillospiraceae bacterium]
MKPCAVNCCVSSGSGLRLFSYTYFAAANTASKTGAKVILAEQNAGAAAAIAV